MFLGQMRPVDKATAYKKLKANVAITGAFVAVLRAVPYVLHYFSQDAHELKLDL